MNLLLWLIPFLFMSIITVLILFSATFCNFIDGEFDMEIREEHLCVVFFWFLFSVCPVLNLFLSILIFVVSIVGFSVRSLVRLQDKLNQKGDNKVSTIDKALRSKKEVEELENQLQDKKFKMEELKQVAKDDLEWILKEENN